MHFLTRSRAFGLAVAVVAMSIGTAVPAYAAPVTHTIEPGVLALFVPLCALMFAILAEAARLVLGRGAPPDAPPNRGQARRITVWAEAADRG